MNRNRMRLSLLPLIVGCCVAAALFFTAAPTASAAPHVPSRAAFARLGGVDLRGYCQSLGYASVTTVGSTVYDWRCINADGSLASFNMDDACSWQYINNVPFEDWITARPTNFYSVTSIVCFSFKRVQGGINLQAYCQSLGYASVTTVGSTVYDWRCVWIGPSLRILASINMTSACTWMYGNRYSLDIFRNFYVSTSIVCVS